MPSPQDAQYKKSNSLSALLLYSIFSIAATFPLILRIGGSIAGDPEADPWKHIWGDWWFRYSLLSRHSLPHHTRLINWPNGGELYHIDPLNALLSVPLQLFLPLSSAHNLLILFNLVLGALGAYFLASYLSGDRRSALISGAIYGFCPYVLAHGVISGVTEAMCTGYVPLYFLFLFRSWREPGLKYPALAAMFLFLSSLGCWYYGFFCVLASIVFILFFSFLREEESIPGRRGDLRLSFPGSHRPARLIFGGLLFLLLIFPLALGFRASVTRPDSVLSPNVGDRQKKTIEDLFNRSVEDSMHLNWLSRVVDSCALTDYLLPGKRNVDYKLDVDKLYRVDYAGFLALAFALVSLKGLGRNRSVQFWFLCALIFLFFSLGPFTRLSRSIYFPEPNPVYLSMFLYFPFFKNIMLFYRFNIMVMLSVSVLASHGLLGLMRNSPERIRAILPPALAVLVLAEFLFFSPVPYPIPLSSARIPGFYEVLAREPGEFCILDLPTRRKTGNLRPGEYYYFQARHHKAIPYKVDGDFSDYLRDNAFFRYVVMKLFDEKVGMLRLLPPGRTMMDSTTAKEGLDDLRKKGFKYIVVHQDMLGSEMIEEVRRSLEEFLGKGTSYPDGIEVYRVENSLKVY